MECHNGQKDRNVNARVNAADDRCTSDKYLVNLGITSNPRVLQARLRSANLTLGFATHL